LKEKLNKTKRDVEAKKWIERLEKGYGKKLLPPNTITNFSDRHKVVVKNNKMPACIGNFPKANTKDETKAYFSCAINCAHRETCESISFKSLGEWNETDKRANKFKNENEDEFLDYLYGEDKPLE